jgi:serine/threonine-protein kinase HipA
MKCLGCFKNAAYIYCASCRKKLFDGLKVSSILPFPSPAGSNGLLFSEFSKHLSISGVQLKYSLSLQSGVFAFTDNDGHYILKPVPAAIHLSMPGDAPENERLSMQIASKIFKINTAPNAIIYFNDGQPAYITKRFDVMPGGGKFLQEDFAQLTGRTRHTHGEAFKYEGSYEELGSVIKKFVPAAIPALEKLFQLIVFNYIISNGDAHLKNFSLIKDKAGEYELTPAYDLMSTAIHTPYETDTALDLYKGEIDSPFYSTYGFYGKPDFMELARRLGLLQQRSEKIIDGFLSKQLQVEELIQQSLLSAEAKKKYLGNLAAKISRFKIPG